MGKLDGLLDPGFYGETSMRIVFVLVDIALTFLDGGIGGKRFYADRIIVGKGCFNCIAKIDGRTVGYCGKDPNYSYYNPGPYDPSVPVPTLARVSPTP